MIAAFNDDARAKLPEFTKQFQPAFPVGVSNREAMVNFLQLPMAKPGYVPKSVFIDRKGIIQAQFSGEDDFFKQEEKNTREMIEKLLKEPAAPKKIVHRAKKAR